MVYLVQAGCSWAKLPAVILSVSRSTTHRRDRDKHIWTDGDDVVRALGGAGEIVARPGEIGPALRSAFDASVPYMVNMMTDPADAYPRSSNLARPPEHS
ncbi:hypothetical protein GCM10023322_09950 [Rugosimonospora acidiphila]|uniref:Transposase n=1 Tax=Rugosimonospora acidiphila TaxID=556531 RepID=A0ABP9RM51_9ACTN